MTLKNIITTLAIGFSAVLFVSCSTSAEKVKQAENAVADANLKLENARKAHAGNVLNFKVETDKKIAVNQKSTLGFNIRMANEIASTKNAYHKKLAELKQKESDLKKKIDHYKMEGK